MLNGPSRRPPGWGGPGQAAALVSGRHVLARTLTNGVWAEPEAAGVGEEGGLGAAGSARQEGMGPGRGLPGAQSGLLSASERLGPQQPQEPQIYVWGAARPAVMGNIL